MKPIIDMHNHTFLSDCCSEEAATGAAFVEKANELGIQVLGISNHGWDERVDGADAWYQKQPLTHVLKIKEELPEDTGNVKVYVGVECEFKGTTGDVGMSLEGARQFDYILIPHSHTHSIDFVFPHDPNYQKAIEQMERRLREAFPEVSDRQIEKWMMMARPADIKAMSGYEIPFDYCCKFLCDGFMTVIEHPEVKKIAREMPVFVAHPFVACGYTYADSRKMVELIPDEKFEEMFTRMAENGIGYDISVSNFKIEDPEHCQMFRILAIAKKCGVKFIFGSDAHTIRDLGASYRSAVIFEKAGLTVEDLHPMVRDYIK